MTEEEVNQLRQENTELKEAVAQRDRRIEELEGLLMGALLRIEELERRQAKDSHNSSKPPLSDGFSRKVSPQKKSGKPSGGQRGHQAIRCLKSRLQTRRSSIDPATVMCAMPSCPRSEGSKKAM